MKYFKYDEKCVRVTDTDGNVITGVADSFPSGYGLHEFGREEEGVQVGGYTLFERDIAKIEILPTFEEAVAAIPPGRYRHFKGNEYEVIAVARHSETEEAMVVYRPLYGDGGLWVRPAAIWNETVERGGQMYKRFEKIED